MLQGAVNNTILKMLGDKCPLEISTGYRLDSTVCSNSKIDDNQTVGKKLEKALLESITGTIKMHTLLVYMHKDFAEASARMTRSAVESHNPKTGNRPVNFTIEDFLLTLLSQQGLCHRKG